MERCEWCGVDPIYVAYHDEEWGVPEYDSRALFEKLVLDGFQAGLSWITILKKRDNFRTAFQGFDPNVIAEYTEDDIARLVADAGIIRHRGKITATITNAQAWQRIEGAGGFDNYIWGFVDGRPIQNSIETMADIQAETDLSRALSKDLKKRGFKFCGPTIVYAFMQAVGMVNDHKVSCPRHEAVKSLAR